jgi:hypothetical protein
VPFRRAIGQHRRHLRDFSDSFGSEFSEVSLRSKDWDILLITSQHFRYA